MVVGRHTNAHRRDINAVAFADPAYKPHVMVSGSDDCLIKVWDRRTLGVEGGRPAGYLPGHHGGITSLAARGDGVYILSNSKDQTAKLWDLRSMMSSEKFESLPPVPPRAQWDYRWMEYPW